MASVYEVELQDPLGNRVDIIDEWESLQYTRSVNSIGVLSIVLDGSYDSSLLTLDSRLIVNRTTSQGTAYRDTDTVFLIRKVDKKLDSSGHFLKIVTALSAIEILGRRVVAYDSGTSQATKSGAADDVMKEIVDENFGSSATDTNRDISAYMSIEGDQTLGPTISKEFSYANVLGVLQDISQDTIQSGSPVYFDVVSPTGTALEFQTFYNIRGNDHTFVSGNNPVTLSPEYKNLININRVFDWTDEMNFVYAGTGGVGNARTVNTACSLSRIQDSPINRREAFISVNSGGGDSLTGEAQSALRLGRPARTFNGELINVEGSTEYGLNWKFGDKLTVEFDGESFDCFVDAVQVTYKKGRETIRATLRVEED